MNPLISMIAQFGLRQPMIYHGTTMFSYELVLDFDEHHQNELLLQLLIWSLSSVNSI